VLCTRGDATNENGVRNAIRKLIKAGLLDDYREKGKAIGFSIVAGGNRRLVLLTDKGKEWYRLAYDKEPAESEIDAFARKHQSVVHGVAILEVRDLLCAAGYQVNDEPGVILADEQEPWHTRTEPDLSLEMDGETWPVEVQRSASARLTPKWRKALEVAGRLVLVLFNEDQMKKQIEILRQADLPSGEIRLTNLEAMESRQWSWHRLDPIR